jgi:hypothetical protein
MESFVTRAGGSKADLIHVYIFVSGRDDQLDMLDVWLRVPVEAIGRRARPSSMKPGARRQGIHLMCVAVVGRGARLIWSAGISKRHPNPMGAKIGGLVLSSGIGGDDPGKVKSRDPTICAGFALQNMATWWRMGGSWRISAWCHHRQRLCRRARDYGAWRRFFPDSADEPARHIMAFGGRGSYPAGPCRGGAGAEIGFALSGHRRSITAPRVRRDVVSRSDAQHSARPDHVRRRAVELREQSLHRGPSIGSISMVCFPASTTKAGSFMVAMKAAWSA